MRIWVAAAVIALGVGCPGNSGGGAPAAVPEDELVDVDREPGEGEAWGIEVACFQCQKVVDYGMAKREFRVQGHRKERVYKNTHLFCSDACNYAFHEHEAQAKAAGKIVCDFCGEEGAKEDATYGNNGAYCSSECSTQYFRASQRILCAEPGCTRGAIAAALAVATGDVEAYCPDHR